MGVGTYIHVIYTSLRHQYNEVRVRICIQCVSTHIEINIDMESRPKWMLIYNITSGWNERGR